MDKIKLGMIGALGRSFGIARDMLATGREVEVTAICDINPGHLQKGVEQITAANGGHKPEAFDDYKDLLKGDLVNAVIIGTPDFVHKEQACAALEAGKHVFCEKPLAISLEDIDTMTRTAEAHPELVFMTGLCLRYNEFFTTMKDIAASGDLGTIKFAYAMDSVSRGGKYYFHRWMSKKKYVNSVLLQKGCHSIDIVNWILDDIPCEVFAYGGLDYFGGSRPAELRCSNCEETADCREYLESHAAEYDTGGAQIDDQCAFSEEIDVNDNTVLLTRYVKGARMSYVENHFTPDYVREFTFVGTEGQMRGTAPQGRTARIEVTLRGPRKWRDEFDLEGRTIDIKLPCVGHGGGDQGIAEAFLHALLDDEQPHADVYAGRECSAIAILGEESIETGKAVPIPDAHGNERKG